ncbi:beta strand repeat-containing protein [Aquabacterium sp.]|uniref:beta strand repeat-containing protein n=1 Tax=Aquabacterium sp. TaxID=1872578 RepID=UPI003D6D1F91
MAAYADRIRENTITSGTGTYTLAGPVQGFRAFSDALTTGAVVTYCVDDGNNWEVGEGTFTIGTPSTITRTTILSSSNSNAAVSWSVGTKSIFLTASATRLVTTDKANTMTGVLTLPSNGLIVGTNQLLVSGGKVGIGTSTLPFALNLASGANTGWIDFISGGLAVGSAGALALFSNNTERIRIDTSGNVGIGTNAPVAKLGVSRGTGATAPTAISAANSYLALGGTEYTTNSYRLVGFGYNNAGTHYPAYLGYQEISSSGSTYGDLVFMTRNVTTDTQPVERLRIDSSGNLGVGVTAAYQLDIGGGATVSPRIQVRRGTDDATQHLRIGYDRIESVRSGTVLASAQTALSFNQVGSDGTRTNLHIDSAGYVGVGTTSPSYKLDVFTSGGANVVASRSTVQPVFRLNDGTNNFDTYLISNVATLRTNTSIPMTFQTNSLERLRIEAAGNVGIGTTPDTAVFSAYRTLAIGSTTSGAALLFQSGTANSANKWLGGIGVLNQASGVSSTESADIGFYQDGIDATAPGASIRFYTRANAGTISERLRIDASGNLLLGTTTSTGYKLEMTGQLGINNGTIYGGVGPGMFASAFGIGSTSNHNLVFGANGNERMRLDTSGNLSIGTVTASYKLHVSGTGAVIAGVEGTTDASFITKVNGSQALYLHSTTALSEINELRALPLVFTVNGAERMRIDSGGNVGIGTSTTTTAFVGYGQLGISGTTGGAMLLQSAGTTRGGMVSDASFTYLYSLGSAPMLFGVGGTGTGTERMRIDTLGNVGIGGAAPSNGKTLAIQNSGTAASTFYLQNSTTGYNAGNGLTLQLASTDGYLWNYNNGLLVFGTNNNERMRIDTGGNVLVTGVGGLGYGTGSGGTVTQATSKSTGVTLNKTNGAITLNAASLAANAVAAFTFTNSTIAATDVVQVCVKSGMVSGGSYHLSVDAVAAGSCNISVRNLTGGALAEGIVLNFAVIKAATS